MTASAPVHELGWLVRDEGGLLLSGNPNAGEPVSAEELTEGTLELHWFDTPAEAEAFAKGVRLSGNNAVTARPGTGAARCGTLVHRMDRDPVPAASLDEAVSLVEHASPTKAQSKLRWKHMEESAYSIAKSRDATVKPVTVEHRDDGRLWIRCSYPHWHHHPDCGRMRSGHVYLFAEKSEDGKERLTVAETMFPNLRAAGGDFETRAANAVAGAGGSMTNGTISFPTDGPLVEQLERLWPTFARLYDIDDEAEAHLEHEATRADPQNRAIAKAIEKGATLSPDGVLTHPDGRAKKVSSGRIRRMAKAGMIDDPTSPPPDPSSFRL